MDRIDLFKGLPSGTVGAEIGVYRGMFSEQILSTPVMHLHLIDCWEPQKGEYEKDPSNISAGGHAANYREVQNRFERELRDDRVTIHRAFSNKAVDNFWPGTLDWVYVDADHTYQGCLQDLIRWSSRIRNAGYLMGHDYVDNKYSKAMGFGVIAAVETFCKDYDWEIIRVTDEEWPSYQLARKALA